MFNLIDSFFLLYYIVINVFIGGPLENQLVEGQPSLKELNMKYEIYEICSTEFSRGKGIEVSGGISFAKSKRSGGGGHLTIFVDVLD